MAAAVCVHNRDFSFPSAGILRRKRSFVKDIQFPYPSLVKKIRLGDHVFRQEIYPPSMQPTKLPTGKADWVEAMIKEMMGSTSVDDAKSRAAGLLESLDKFITTAVSKESEAAARGLRERIEILNKENSILKRGITIQRQRLKEQEEKNKEEVKMMKELVRKYEDQMKNLEVNNYTLKMHLNQALSSSSMGVGFTPEVF